MALAHRFVTFLTDFGLRDDFVGTCHGVIKRIAPDVEIIDVTHGIAPQNVLQGALVLANTIPYMPEGVHLAVVDPGVGGRRKALVVRDVSGRVFVGPDNGLLVPAAEGPGGGIADVRELTNREYALPWISHTFHGRDVFAPAAAHIALGVPVEELGPSLDPGELARLELPEPEVAQRRIVATVITSDAFGNVQLNLTTRHLADVGIEPGDRIEIALRTERYYATAARTFADARPGDLLLYEDSYRNVSIAISGGNAAEMFGVAPGERLRIHPRPQ